MQSSGGMRREIAKVCFAYPKAVLSSPSPRACGERVGVRGSLHAFDSRREPLTRRYAPTSPREERGEVTWYADAGCLNHEHAAI
jgi:hypothetical protein